MRSLKTQPEWDLEALNKAYRRGYITGLSGEGQVDCPYNKEVLVAAWEAGWADGYEQFEILSPKKRQFA